MGHLEWSPLTNFEKNGLSTRNPFYISQMQGECQRITSGKQFKKQIRIGVSNFLFNLPTLFIYLFLKHCSTSNIPFISHCLSQVECSLFLESTILLLLRQIIVLPGIQKEPDLAFNNESSHSKTVSLLFFYQTMSATNRISSMTQKELEDTS